MRITEIQLRGSTLPWRQEGHDGVLADLSPQLNVFSGPAGVGKSALARMIANLLYGKTPGRGEAPPAEGGLVVQGQGGEYVLQRVDDGRPQGRLTIAGRGGAATDSQTVRTLLSGLDPTLVGRLYAIDFRYPPPIEFLTQEALAGRTTLGRGDSERSPLPLAGGPGSAKTRQHIEALVGRRDEVAQAIETFYAERRSDSGVLERQLQEVDHALSERRRHAQQLKTEIANIENRLAEIEAQLRYFSLATHLVDDARGTDDASAREIEALDEEIGRSRQMIADVEPRADKVRRDLAALQPGGPADDIAGLAEQRIALQAVEGLLDDLEAEIALLARSPETTRPTAEGAHARMRPAAALLRQQVYVLCGQISAQQQAAERRFLEQEDERLERVQRDLSDQLETLLRRRQALTTARRLMARPALAEPAAPAAEQCRCTGHRDAHAHGIAFDGPQVGDPKLLDELQGERASLLERRRRQTDQLAEIGRETAAAEQQWQTLQRKRSRLAGRDSLEDLREELARLEAQIEACLDPPANLASPHESRRASDLLAQLTDGRLVQIRTRADAAEPTIIDRSGRVIRWSSLSATEVDQVALAIALSLTAWHAEQGISLPLVLDEPFLRLDAAEAAVMAGVLEEFSRAGHQMLVFSADREACRRFESLGIVVRQLGIPVPRPAASRAPEKAPVPAAAATTFRIVREPADVVARTQSEVAAPASSEELEEIYYLTPEATLNHFPVLGAETQGAFAELELQTVGQLLAADPQQVADSLQRAAITKETVRLWQAHMALMCFVPGVSLDDAQVLTACEVWSPAELADVALEMLVARAERFFLDERGGRFAAVRSRFTTASLDGWQRTARRNRRRWQQYGSARRSGDNRTDGRAREQTAPAERPRRSAKQAGKTTGRRSQPRSKRRAPLRFLLDSTSPVVDAPSIGAKTAERLAAVGIRTVADLLNADAASTAAELNVRHISATAIAAWQCQARLVCCIPELRGYAAQLLVGCGLVEPDQVAQADAEELAREVRRYAATKEGQRILRDRPAPEGAKIARWVEFAAEQRPLEAA